MTIRELREGWQGEVIRLTMLQTHYRQPINWTETGLREANRMLDHWYQLTANVEPGFLCADMMDTLADDLNAPKAIASLHELRSESAKGSHGAAAWHNASPLVASTCFLHIAFSIHNTFENTRHSPSPQPLRSPEL